MPPFAGQGMCGGLRDVFNLAWKVDLVLRGTASDSVLDTYSTERIPHVRYFMDFSIELGKVICVPSETEAAERDAQMMAAIADPALAPPPPSPPRLGPGLIRNGDPRAGLLSIQSRVEYRGRTGLFDDVIGRGWFVLTTSHIDVSASAQRVIDRLSAVVLQVGRPDTDHADVLDLGGRYVLWLTELDADIVIIRPDFYVYAATRAWGLDEVLSELAAQLDGTGIRISEHVTNAV